MKAEFIRAGLTDELVGESACMRHLREQIAAVAAYDVNLVLQGESGTGKEIISRTVHKLSNRHAAPFIGVNCAAIHEALLESELFGHEAGAFTGARSATPGYFRATDGGTILLDEVGDMSDSLQSKLLRVLAEHTVTPVGGTQPVPIDVRVIAATHRDLAKAVYEGTFRQDLYYRLNVVCLSVPPLRDRLSDIPILVEHLLRRSSEILKLPIKRTSSNALAVLMHHHWPGNVRELGNVIQRAYVLGRGSVIKAADLPEELLARAAQQPDGVFPTLHEVVHGHVMKALEESNGVRVQAATMLGINRTSLWRMLNRYEHEMVG